MRQTSRAVALLLAVESAQALTDNSPDIASGNAYYETVWMPLISDANAPTTTMQLNSRTAGYNGTQQSFGLTAVAGNTEWQLLSTNNYQKSACGDTQVQSTMVAGSHCMPCIASGSVWCSRTYSYVETGSSDYQFLNINNTTTRGLLYPGANTAKTLESQMVAGEALDEGSCCGSAAEFTLFVGDQKVKADPTAIPNAKGSAHPLVSGACVAFQNTAYVVGVAAAPATAADESSWGISAIDNTNTATSQFTSWWCSNGLYKKVTANDASCVVGANCTIDVNAQQQIGYGMNKRKELAQVGCPQKESQCGSASIVTALVDGSSAVTISVATGVLGPTVNDKCTWVATGVVVAPTFYMSSGTPALGITTSNWQIHTMEYTSTALGASFSQSVGSLQGSDAANQKGLVTRGSALQAESYIPRFNMPAEQFATLRTWYGEAISLQTIDTYSNLPASWLTPGQAPISNAANASLNLASSESQQYGNVVNVPVSKIATTTTSSDVPVGTANFGIVNAIPFDLRVARYFPAQVAQTVWAAGSAQQALYVSSKSTYDAAKTMWDNYVALLEKNAKTDAFAALFSPPKAPTVPPMPNMPWKPNAYNGYVQATPEQQFNYLESSRQGFYNTAANQPTAQQFWATITSAQTVGGWGSFTAQILRFRNLWGKSFGTIGYSGDTDKNKRSVVWQYKWTCGATPITTSSTTTPCDMSYTLGAVTSPTYVTTKSNSAANTTILVSVVTLWSTSNNNVTGVAGVIATEYDWANSSLDIVWVKETWSTSLVGLSAIAAPVAATAAKGLSGVAGAQALAATSAAALAVAAALY